MEQKQLKMLCEEYLPAFFAFAISKTGNTAEAEELSQEIAFQCVSSIRRGGPNGDFNAYVWSIAHNTCKRWYARQARLRQTASFCDDTFSNLAGDAPSPAEEVVAGEEENAVRLALSRLERAYRKTLVCFYYEGLSIAQTARRLSITEGMVKFYLRTGKQKLKEAIQMERIGEKSFSPSELSVYKSAIDFSKVNVWEVFSRILPKQLALLCHDGAKTIGALSEETGVPAVYLEEEVGLLQEAGVMISPVKDKYRTNLFILKKETAEQVKVQFDKLYEQYTPKVVEAYEAYLPRLKECGVFRFDALKAQWKWFFAHFVPDFDYTGQHMSDEDYPQILSCGSRAFIFAEEAGGSPFAAGQTPTDLPECTVWPVDVAIFGPYHRQKELWDRKKAQALYDVYRERIKEEDAGLYAELIAEGYVLRRGDALLCNVAVQTAKSRALFSEIEKELNRELEKTCAAIRDNITRLCKAAIPDQLRPYAEGFAKTWISFYAGVNFYEALYNIGFLTVPKEDDLTPVACRIEEK